MYGTSYNNNAKQPLGMSKNYMKLETKRVAVVKLNNSTCSKFKIFLYAKSKV